MFVVGTAGHVDHGKSTLIEALTGIDPDRLKEEKEREMTIDLGFAWVKLPNGETIGIVDVPGHRDFIENMLAGIGGIDAALLVIAADEGVMPQTREHLAILDLLDIESCIVALTKTDLIDDPEWIELVTLDISETLENTALANAPIIPVSARTREGLDNLASAIATCLDDHPPRRDLGHPRLPVDRVFTLSGFGTIVTGTLTDGTLAIGDTVEIQPGGQSARIRGLQTHGEKIDRATPGNRVAVNLTGLSKDDIARGQVITNPGWLTPTLLVDVEYRHLADLKYSLEHNIEVKLFSGSAEVLARTRVLGQEQIAPGEHGWLQLRLKQPIALVRGDHFILRRPSPGQTLGGGNIIDAAPRRRHRRFRPDLIEHLNILARGTPEEVVLQALEARGPLTSAETVKETGLDEKTIAALVSKMIDARQIVPLGNHGPARLLLSTGRWNALQEKARTQLEDYHRNHPLKPGMMREELKSKLKLSPHEFNGFMERAALQGSILDEGVTVKLPTHEIRFTEAQQKAVDNLLKKFEMDPFGTPSFKESANMVSEAVLGVLIARGDIVQASAEVLFSAQTVDQARHTIVKYVTRHGSITVAQARDLFHSSRKYVLSLLEHFDQQGVTRREGDERILVK